MSSSVSGTLSSASWLTTTSAQTSGMGTCMTRIVSGQARFHRGACVARGSPEPTRRVLFLASTLVGPDHFFAGRYDEACSCGERGLRENPNWAGAARTAAMSMPSPDGSTRRTKRMARLRQIERVFDIKRMFPFRPGGRYHKVRRGPAKSRAAGVVGRSIFVKLQ